MKKNNSQLSPTETGNSNCLQEINFERTRGTKSEVILLAYSYNGEVDEGKETCMMFNNKKFVQTV